MLGAGVVPRHAHRDLPQVRDRARGARQRHVGRRAATEQQVRVQRQGLRELARALPGHEQPVRAEGPRSGPPLVLVHAWPRPGCAAARLASSTPMLSAICSGVIWCAGIPVLAAMPARM